MMQTTDNQTSMSPGVRRAAILVLVLGNDVAKRVFDRIPEGEIRRLASAARELTSVTRTEVEAVLREYLRAHQGGHIPEDRAGGALEFMMERALGQEHLRALLADTGSLGPFEVIAAAPVDLLSGLLRNEHPQTVAIVLASLPAGHAGRVLEALGPDSSSEILYRLATLGDVPEDVRREVGVTLAAELQAMGTTSGSGTMDGQGIAVEITKTLNSAFSDEMLELLEEADEDFANGIRSKLFVFDDLAQLDARTMQRLLREVDSKALMVALKGTPPETQDAVFSAMSSRAAEMLREDMEASAPVRIKDVEEAQTSVIEVAFRLENEGAIALPRGGAGEMV
ncbi:MAG: flagellar motor switch protein FliG [Bradymonadia bacterium]|jgi:flagellar motor switch protein FliG